MSSGESTEVDDAVYDPIFLNSRREALVIFSVWAVALVWAVPYCYFNGYSALSDSSSVETVWGIPSWVFWGIFAPWLIADIFTTWFCFCYMADDELGEAHEGADIAEDIAASTAAEAEGDDE